MNKLYALFIVTIIIGCDSSRNLSIESLIENKDLDELKKRKKEAQSTIGKFATIKASAVAINPLVFFDIVGSFALDTALISELSKVLSLIHI